MHKYIAYCNTGTDTAVSDVAKKTTTLRRVNLNRELGFS